MSAPRYRNSIDAEKLTNQGAFPCAKCGTSVSFRFHGLSRVGVEFADCVVVLCPHCAVELVVYRHLDNDVLVEAFDDPCDRIERLIELQELRRKL